MEIYGLQQTVPPVDEPVSLDFAKKHSRVLNNAENDLVQEYLGTAREFIETVTDLQFMTATWVLTLRGFPGSVPGIIPGPAWPGAQVIFPHPPLQSVVQVQYVDTDGNTQVLSPALYQVMTSSLLGRMWPARLQVWPITDPQTLNAVIITYKAGYGDASKVPKRAKQAIRVLATHMYENRQVAAERGGFQKTLLEVPIGLRSMIQSLNPARY